MSISTRVVCHLAAHVVACHLHLEECAVCTHAELVAHPVATPRRVPAGGTGQARWADHHASIEDDAVFLGGQEYGLATSTKWAQKKVIKLDKTCEISRGRGQWESKVTIRTTVTIAKPNTRRSQE